MRGRYWDAGKLRVLGYQWRVLRFNSVTRQSTAKVMAAYQENKPDSVYLMQQPHCLAVPCTFLNHFSTVNNSYENLASLLIIPESQFGISVN